ncbi:MAG TPA: CorA family divalent cation transporter [Candidatus Thermoplasmatota archaeon]|nr:CorA family divalent cation transporter [Candidatus Thermoplasmatota archaeon]
MAADARREHAPLGGVADPDAEEPGGHGSRGVLIGLLQTGKTTRLEGASPSEFVQTIRKSSIAWVNFGVHDLLKDGERVASLLGFSGNMIETLLSGRLSGYEDRETELGLLVPVVRVEELRVTVHPLIVLVRDNLILTLHEEQKVVRLVKFGRYADTFMRKIPRDLPTNDRVTIVLTRLINENNDRNFDGLRSIEEHGDRLAESLVKTSGRPQDLGPRIYDMKHALITYLDALWASLDVVQSLRFGDAETMSDDETLLARVALLSDDIRRHIQLSEHMSEVLASGLEVMQSIYNNQLQLLNNRMSLVITWLTVLGTAVLVPNTIATIAATGAYEIGPEDQIWFTVMIILSTALATGAAYWWIRRRGLFPKTDVD